jgi:hypothetical protein
MHPKCGSCSGITFAPSCVLPSLEGSSACLVMAERCDDHRFSFSVAACISGRQCQRIDPELWSHEMTGDDLTCIIVAFVRDGLGIKCYCRYVYKSNDMLYAVVSPVLGDLNPFQGERKMAPEAPSHQPPCVSDLSCAFAVAF